MKGVYLGVHDRVLCYGLRQNIAFIKRVYLDDRQGKGKLRKVAVLSVLRLEVV